MPNVTDDLFTQAAAPIAKAASLFRDVHLGEVVRIVFVNRHAESPLPVYATILFASRAVLFPKHGETVYVTACVQADAIDAANTNLRPGSVLVFDIDRIETVERVHPQPRRVTPDTEETIGARHVVWREQRTAPETIDPFEAPRRLPKSAYEDVVTRALLDLEARGLLAFRHDVGADRPGIVYKAHSACFLTSTP